MQERGLQVRTDELVVAARVVGSAAAQARSFAGGTGSLRGACSDTGSGALDAALDDVVGAWRHALADSAEDLRLLADVLRLVADAYAGTDDRVAR